MAMIKDTGFSVVVWCLQNTLSKENYQTLALSKVSPKNTSVPLGLIQGIDSKSGLIFFTYIFVDEVLPFK